MFSVLAGVLLSSVMYADDTIPSTPDMPIDTSIQSPQQNVLQSNTASPTDLLNPDNGVSINYKPLNKAGIYPIAGQLLIDRYVKVLSVATSSMTVTSATIKNLFVNGTLFTPTSAGQYPGTTTNDNASAGNIGEYVQSTWTVRSGALALVNNTPKTIASIVLTAGDWDVRVIGSFLASGAVTLTEARVGISLTPNSVTGGDVASFPTSNEVTIIDAGANLIASNDVFTIPIPNTRITLASTTTLYFTETQTFSGGTSLSGFGSISARRVR